jgi:predicted Zn-dependent protease
LRPLLLAAAITLAIACPLSLPAQEAKLPNIGSSAGELLTPARQAEYGAMMLRELRNYDYVLEDPLLEEWLQNMGDRLVSNSDTPQQPFTFFLMRERQINAFATLGGYVAVNAGLILTAKREDEAAGVLAHEIAHVSQQHVLRAVERAQRDQVPILLGMLAAIIAAQSVGGSSSSDATQAALVSGMGLMQQNQINYTRANESEADRIGIRTLFRSGYDATAMADFFERMSLATRGNQGGYSLPDYLSTHPVTTIRISEAKQRAEQLTRNTIVGRTSVDGGEPRVERLNPNTIPASRPISPNDNPLLPGTLEWSGIDIRQGEVDRQFEWAKERLRVLTAANPDAALREYESIRRGSAEGLNDPQQYGLALVHMQKDADSAIADLSDLLRKHPDNLWIAVALGQAESLAGKPAVANQHFETLLRQMPQHRAIILTYADVLNRQSTRESGRRAQTLLRPLSSSSGEDPVFQETFARACELAGDSMRAGEAYAEVAFLNGRPEQALMQLQNLKRRDDLDYVTRARVDARIAAITPTVLELRRQGIRDPSAQSP